jgi:hypothetical protein
VKVVVVTTGAAGKLIPKAVVAAHEFNPFLRGCGRVTREDEKRHGQQ